jgi:hypothetical protein
LWEAKKDYTRTNGEEGDNKGSEKREGWKGGEEERRGKKGRKKNTKKHTKSYLKKQKNIPTQTTNNTPSK